MEPLPTIIIALVSAIIGGLLRPWGQDWVAKRAEARAEKRAWADERKQRIQRVIDCLSEPSPSGFMSASAGRAYRELPAAAAAVGDDDLTRKVDEVITARLGSPQWFHARNAASSRAGELLAAFSG
jgi:hypothetical protein